MPESDSSSLDEIIVPEVHEDAFSELIRNLAATAEIDTVLEIGSSSGEGSTKAWVEGLARNPCRPKLYCMEVSKVRHRALSDHWSEYDFVECIWGSSVGVADFPSEEEVIEFHAGTEGPLKEYSIDEVLKWRREDVEYIRREQAPEGSIQRIKEEAGIERFGAVLIDGSEFTGNVELDLVYGAEFILLDDIETYKCHQAHQRLLADPAYELLLADSSVRHGFSAFRRRRSVAFDPLPEEAPVHFFTIVLNGEPFLRYHIEVLSRLPFRWHWHVVEGVASHRHDTAWGAENGGLLPEGFHRNGLSSDGTSGYLDELKARFPDQISIYRKPSGQFWDGKIEMVSEPLKHLFEEGLLWQIDVDELWTAEQIIRMREMFLEHPEKSAAWFWCRFFVGPRLMVSTRECYSQSSEHEWIRVWRFRPGMQWITHEPPSLGEPGEKGELRDVAKRSPFRQRETEAAGLVFQHFAYATESQVRFKEDYYGYAGAVSAWRALQDQAATEVEIPLADHFPWVTDGTRVDRCDRLGVEPLARPDATGEQWVFREGQPSASAVKEPTVVIDGVFFQYAQTGIGRCWQEIVAEWSKSGFAEQVWFLDRDGTLPDLPGIRRRRIPAHQPEEPGKEAISLQRHCDELGADVFISTYYTAPTHTPSVAMIYDMIPELLGMDLSGWDWRLKRLAIQQAGRVACISESTRRDAVRLSRVPEEKEFSVVHLAAPSGYSEAGPEEIAEFRSRHGLGEHYIMVSGERMGLPVAGQGYKNAALAFRAWSLLPKSWQEKVTILCTGGKPELETALRELAPGARTVLARLSDEDLRTAFSGATALIYPSLYEGFGLPVIEAMACGCPVVTSPRGSLPEVAGDAAILVETWDTEGTAEALLRLLEVPEQRRNHAEAGKLQAASFSYQKAAAELAGMLRQASLDPLPPSLWAEFREGEQALKEKQDALQGARQKLKEQNRKLEKVRGQLEKMTTKFETEREKRRHPLRALWRRIQGRKR